MNNETIGEAPRFIGRFYFKLTVNGNLLGEYSNNHKDCIRSCVEAANRTSEWPVGSEKPGEKFVGEYISTWLEGKKCDKVNLTITRREGSESMFLVRWSEKFEGQGMLCDDILIGDYRPV